MMKKEIKLLIFIFLAIFFIFLSINLKVKAYGDLDRIHLYEVKVTPRKEDGSLDIDIHINWEVLDSYSEGPLEWVKIGIPNYHVKELNAKTGNIKKIKYYTEDGSYIRIDFKKSYYAGEIVDFSFSFNQSYMYHLYDDIVIYDYHPGWFEDILVDTCNLYWYADGIKEMGDQSLPIENEDGYIKLSSPLNYGGTIKISLSYEQSHFNELDAKKQYTSNYVPLSRILIIIGVVATVIALIIILSAYAKSKQDPYMNERGFVSGYYHWYIFSGGRSRHYYGKTVNSKGARIVNPSSDGSSGGFHGGGGGCACACACACAGGGRAGCSKKDFYHTNLSSEKVLRILNKQ